MAKDPSTIEELIRLVKASGEDSNVDAKSPLAWDEGENSAALAKDIAAFANSRDGGAIVIGKRQNGTQFEFLGVTEDQAATFDTTRVANWVHTRFNPPITLVCHTVEFDGRLYVVIVVSEFADIPILCVRNFDSLSEKGKQIIKDRTIYVRNSKAESAPVGSPDELRELIGLATGKRADEMLATFHAMLRGKPLVAPPSDDEQFTKQFATVKETVEGQIADRFADGGWCMSFHPSTFRPDRFLEIDQLENIIARHAVRLMDEFPASRVGTTGFNWGIGNSYYGESWGFSREGLFVWCEAFRENTYNYKSPWRQPSGEPYPEIPQGQWINFKPNLFKTIDFFAFMARMLPVFDPAESLSYRLRAGPLAKRRLVTSSTELGFRSQYAEEANENFFDFEKAMEIQEFQATWKDECVIAAKRFFELFPGERITVEGLRQWVDRYLARNFGN